MQVEDAMLMVFAGNEEKAIVLPRKVVELLSWKSTDPKEIVLQLEKSLQVDQSSLEQPGTETKKLIRYVASKAKRLDRLDVVKHLREITPAGTTGELLIRLLTGLVIIPVTIIHVVELTFIFFLWAPSLSCFRLTAPFL